MSSFSRICQRLGRSGALPRILFVVGIIFVVSNWWLLGNLSTKWSYGSANNNPKLAFATLLLASGNSSATTTDSDAYLLSTRILNYQLQHAPTTKSSQYIPFLVLVTPDVPECHCKRLLRDGVTLIQVEKLDLPWMEPLSERWRDVMVKLRLFQMTSYDKILFLDADTFLLSPLDGVFSDPAGVPQKTLKVAPIRPDEESLPQTYLFSTLPEVTQKIHSYPPLTLPYFNAGFFLLGPSPSLYSYYLSLMKLEERFDSTYPEQNLLNYAHRENGNMPWGRLHYSWNIELPNMEDVEKGVASVHSKLWTMGNELQPTESKLRERWRVARGEMEAFWGE